jgi:hypothetical protein
VDLTQWRVVLNSSERAELVQDVPAPWFDKVRHAGVCSEVWFFAYTTIFYSKLLCLIAKVSICCHHSSQEKSVDCGLF